MVILNDRIPIRGHDPGLIADQLLTLYETLHPTRFLLDLQRSSCPETAAAAHRIIDTLPCPVGVTEQYAKDLNCPVFLAPPPLDMTLADYLHPWSGREIWLETAPDACRINVTADGSTVSAIPWDSPPDGSFSDPVLYCSYKAHVTQNCIFFDLYRSAQDITDLLLQAEALGVTKAIGLYQQFYQISF